MIQFPRPVALLLRLEGLALFAAATLAFWKFDYSWWSFTWMSLLPDLAMIGYARGPRFGAICYNLTHTTALPLALMAFIGWFQGEVSMIGLIWLAHIGFDRALGYGLKGSAAFTETHLGAIGGNARPAAKEPTPESTS